ncbi:MAG: preprotein translocase subunit SecE [Nitrospirae bacterium]|nr:MAG: preprotein translocase subunit SecE [Nitrospirota bacterium]
MIEKIKEFFKEVKIEAKKVVYPNRDELIGSTWVVIITVLLVAVFLGIIDRGLSKVVSGLLR